MEVKKFTDLNYIPLSELANFGSSFLKELKEYRLSFLEIIVLDNFKFVNLIETPTLIKKRYSKNVELKGHINLKAPDNDFILEIAKQIIKDEKNDLISNQDKKLLLKQFYDNDMDLTIITNYLIKNIDTLFIKKKTNFQTLFPSLSNHDLTFVENANKIDQNYTIQNYIDLTNVSYETARKSLEKMSELGIYQKIKIGKKFVYCYSWDKNEI